MDIKKLIEDYDSLDNGIEITGTEEPRRKFCEEFEMFISQKFAPLERELLDLVLESKKQFPDTNEYSLPVDISRSIDRIAFLAASVYDILNGDEKVGKKIKKALGYNG